MKQETSNLIITETLPVEVENSKLKLQSGGKEGFKQKVNNILKHNKMAPARPLL